MKQVSATNLVWGGKLASVIVLWSVAPILKRFLVDAMSHADDKSRAVREFVALHSCLSCFAACLFLPVMSKIWISEACATLHHLDLQAWALFLVAALLAIVTAILLVDLLTVGNPGITMLLLNGGTNALSYVVGSIFVREAITPKGVGGVLLICLGAGLVKA
jgi:drug/metabolite transporter (DMT)-like permease